MKFFTLAIYARTKVTAVIAFFTHGITNANDTIANSTMKVHATFRALKTVIAVPNGTMNSLNEVSE